MKLKPQFREHETRSNETKKLKPQFREIEIKSFDEENRTIDLSFSSEDPYERYWGVEILDHSAKSVDMSRLNNSAPLLFNHDRDVVLGVVESAKIENKRGIATVRFGNSAKANEVFSDVVDNIMKNVSVGYQINEMTLESKEGSVDTYRVTSWQPFEISIVSIPADTTVGIGRGSEDLTESDVNIINIIKPKEEESKEMDPKELEAQKETAKKEARAAEKARVKEITAIANKHGLEDEAQKALDDDMSVDDFRVLALERLGKTKQIDTKANDVLDEDEVRAYSLSRAIRAAITKDWSKAKVELDASNKVAKLLGKDSRGFYIPHQILQRELTTTGGAALIDTTDGGASFIDILRNKLALAKMGATVLGGLSGNVAIPKKTGSTTAYWIAEGEDVTGSDLTLGMLNLSPKTVSAKTAYSRQMLLQGNPSIEALVMNDLADVIALAIDAAGLNGSGANGQPTGILNTTGINAVDCSTAAGGLTFAKAVELETGIASGNADVDNMNYIAGASVTGKLKTTPVAAGNPKMILENGEVNGYKHTRSNQVPANTLVFGDFTQLIFALWGGLDIMIDEYANADAGGIVIRAFQSLDVGVRESASFSATKNIDQ